MMIIMRISYTDSSKIKIKSLYSGTPPHEHNPFEESCS